jgi:hypothetical protein
VRSLTPSPILQLPSPKTQQQQQQQQQQQHQHDRRLVVVAAAAGAGGDGQEQQQSSPPPQEQQRGLTWGAPSVTAGSSTVAAQHQQQLQQQQAHAQHRTQPAPPSASASSLSTADVMSLDSIRSTLIRQEDSIIFALIERAQFRRNEAIYARGILQLDPSIPDYDFLRTLSFLEYLLLETEKLHGKGACRRAVWVWVWVGFAWLVGVGWRFD